MCVCPHVRMLYACTRKYIHRCVLCGVFVHAGAVFVCACVLGAIKAARWSCQSPRTLLLQLGLLLPVPQSELCVASSPAAPISTSHRAGARPRPGGGRLLSGVTLPWVSSRGVASLEGLGCCMGELGGGGGTALGLGLRQRCQAGAVRTAARDSMAHCTHLPRGAD